MMSKMGGKMMFYYSDKLVDMLLDDLLKDVAVDMQNIEEKNRKTEVVHESKKLAADLIKHI